MQQGVKIVAMAACLVSAAVWPAPAEEVKAPEAPAATAQPAEAPKAETPAAEAPKAEAAKEATKEATKEAPKEAAKPEDAPKAEDDVKVTDSVPEAQLTPEEKAEREARKACKIEICAAFRKPNATGNDIACDVIKSWRKEQLAKLVGRLKVSWPYGPVRCTSAVKLKRSELHKAMTEPKHESQMDKQEVSCVVDREKEPAADIKFDFSPKVTFEKGLATKAKMNWGKIEAPTLIKGALWTATAADNMASLLSSSLVEDINGFIGKKCDEVKDDWAAK